MGPTVSQDELRSVTVDRNVTIIVRDREERLLALAHEVPVAGMIAAWQDVEGTLLDIAPAEMRSQRAYFPSVIASLGEIPDDIKRSLEALRRLKEEAEQASPGQSPSPEAAVKYVDSCLALLDWLRAYRSQRASD